MTQPQTTLTVQDYEAAGIADRFRQVMDIIKVFGDFDFDKISELLAALRKIIDAPDLRSRIRAGIEGLAVIASMTPFEQDDHIVEVIQSILTDELLDIIERLFSGLTGNSAVAQDATIQIADRQTATAKGVPWSFLVQVALRLVDLFDCLKID